MTDGGLTNAVRSVLASAADHDAPADVLAGLRNRLDEPVRVAIVGRVNTGKSTLLNALVGERIAPTDAGETTRVVTWYRSAPSYDVRAVLRDGGQRRLRMTDGHRIDLGGLAPESVHRVEVGRPSRKLEEMTLVDTPGLDALSEASTSTEGDLLEDRTGVDAVVYLLRHLHDTDARLLEAFRDRRLGDASLVTSLAVLSRADEVGAGRLDAMEAAARVAGRYRADLRLRSLAGDVVPVAGLLAETGTTLTENEAAALEHTARLGSDRLRAVLRSVDRFAEADLPAVPGDVRAGLLDRLGLFGVRFAVERVRAGRLGAIELGADLVGASGVPALIASIDRLFTTRSEVLRARSVLASVRSLARSMDRAGHPGAPPIAAAAERVQASAHQFAELRLDHLVRLELAELTDAERAEVTALLDGSLDTDLTDGSDGAAGRLLTAVQRWRTRAAMPLNTPETAEAAELVARSYEVRHAALTT